MISHLTIEKILSLAPLKAPTSTSTSLESDRLESLQQDASTTTIPHISRRNIPKSSSSEKRAQKKLSQHWESLTATEAPLSTHPQWIVWHALKLIELPLQLPLPAGTPTLDDPADDSSVINSILIYILNALQSSSSSSSSSSSKQFSYSTSSSLPIENIIFEHRNLKRYLDKYRYLEIGAKHQLGRALLKLGYLNAGRHHLAVGSLPWEKGAEFGSSYHSARLLSSALLLPLVSTSERDLSVSLTSIENDVTNLLSDLSIKKINKKTKINKINKEEEGGRIQYRNKNDKDDYAKTFKLKNEQNQLLFGVSVDQAIPIMGDQDMSTHFSTVETSSSSGDIKHSTKSGGGGVPWDRDQKNSPGRIQDPSSSSSSSASPRSRSTMAKLLNESTCGGSTISEALDASSAMSSALETWPLEYWSGYYPRDEVDMILHRAGVAQPAGRPPLGLLVAEITRKLCPLLIEDVPPLPKIVSSPQPSKRPSQNVYFDNDEDEDDGYDDEYDIITRALSASSSYSSSSKEASKAPFVVGIVSARMRNNPAARYITGWVQHLCKEIPRERRVRVVAMCFPTVVDHWTRIMIGTVHGSINLVPSLEESSRRIKATKPDVLIFVDLPLDFRSYALAHLRLANIQIAFWGHAHSSQLASIDYFILPPGAAPGLLFSPIPGSPPPSSSSSSSSPQSGSALLGLASVVAEAAVRGSSATSHASLGLLSNGYGSLENEGSDPGYYLESSSRFSEQPILLGGSGSFFDPIIAASIVNQSHMNMFYDSLSWITLTELMKPPNWITSYETLQNKYLLPEMIAMMKDKNNNHDKTDDKEEEEEEESDVKKRPPTFIALPIKTHQWHPSFDDAVASILMQSDQNLYLYVFAEHSSVEYAAADDLLSRHDIHQAASPPLWEKRLRSRLASRLPTKARAQLMKKIFWLPPLFTKDYLSLLYYATCSLDSFPVTNTIAVLDSFSVGTPIITVPFKQRESFQTCSSLWHSLFAYCPSSSSYLITNLTNNYEINIKKYLKNEKELRKIQKIKKGKETINDEREFHMIKNKIELSKQQIDNTNNVDVNDKKATTLHTRSTQHFKVFDEEGDNEFKKQKHNIDDEEEEEEEDDEEEALYRSFSSIFAPPVVKDVSEMAKLAISISKPSNPLRTYLRGVLFACRGAIFNDQTYALELRRFLLSTIKSVEHSGHLYPPEAGKAFIPLLR